MFQEYASVLLIKNLKTRYQLCVAERWTERLSCSYATGAYPNLFSQNQAAHSHVKTSSTTVSSLNILLFLLVSLFFAPKMLGQARNKKDLVMQFLLKSHILVQILS